jgi:LysM repeat protein
VSLPSGLPTGPTVFVALAMVVLAFLLGRASGGGGDDVATRNVRTVASTTTTTGAPSYHTVGDNETLSSIASQYGLTTDELAVANGIGDVNHVQEGQRLIIPATTLPTLAPTSTAPKRKKN